MRQPWQEADNVNTASKFWASCRALRLQLKRPELALTTPPTARGRSTCPCFSGVCCGPSSSPNCRSNENGKLSLRGGGYLRNCKDSSRNTLASQQSLCSRRNLASPTRRCSRDSQAVQVHLAAKTAQPLAITGADALVLLRDARVARYGPSGAPR